MAARAKRRIVTVSAVVILIGAAVLWWDLFRDGATLRGALLPLLLTGLGFFWLAVGFRESGPEGVEADR